MPNSGRDREKSKWRGKVLRIDQERPRHAAGARFPLVPQEMADHPDDQIFVSDNQGAVGTRSTKSTISSREPHASARACTKRIPNAPIAAASAIQIPHPWTRSSERPLLSAAGERGPRPSLRRHTASVANTTAGSRCDSRCSRLVTRFRVRSILCASRRLPVRDGFLGTLCGARSFPNGGYLHRQRPTTGGWLGGPNIGDIDTACDRTRQTARRHP